MATSLTTNGLVMAASASQVADVNTLDDYQEGTHTSIFIHSGSSYSYGDQLGHYFKIGKNVTFASYTALNGSGSSFSGTSATLFTGGLPFTSLNTAQVFGMTSCGYTYKIGWHKTTSGDLSGHTIYCPRVEQNATTCSLIASESTGLGYGLDGNDCIAHGARIQTGGWYLTSS
jgi:hypothetical protein